MLISKTLNVRICFHDCFTCSILEKQTPTWLFWLLDDSVYTSNFQGIYKTVQ